MRTWIFAALVVPLVVFLTGGPAGAQAFPAPYVSPYTQPPVSPYLNLLRAGNPAINYYGLVRPLQQYNAAFQQMALQQPYANPALAAPDYSGLMLTGHPATFMNFSHYYNGRITGSATLPPAVVPPANIPPAIVPPATALGAAGAPVGAGYPWWGSGYPGPSAFPPPAALPAVPAVPPTPPAVP